MFEARPSKHSEATVHAKNIYDENKIFYCLNPECSAEYKLRSHHGRYSQHFYSFPNSKGHIAGCIFIDDSNEKYFKNNVDKFNIEDIFNKTISSKGTTTKPIAQNSNTDTASKEYQLKTIINSSKSLLKFCSGNTINTPINESLTINDIFIDQRNVYQYYLGFNGLKMINGTTFSFNKDDKSFKCTVKSKSSSIWLNVIVYLPDNLYNECIRFIYTNNNQKFSGYPITIFAQWNKPKDYWVQAEVVSKGQVIYK